MEHPKEKGDRSTMAIILALHEAGLAVYLPFGENTRSDLILEDRDRIKRVQCRRAGSATARWSSPLAAHTRTTVVPAAPGAPTTGRSTFSLSIARKPQAST